MPKKRALTAEQPSRVKTFDEAFEDFRITPSERVAMVWHLAMMRARRTVEALLPATDSTAILGFDPKQILR